MAFLRSLRGLLFSTFLRIRKMRSKAQFLSSPQFSKLSEQIDRHFEHLGLDNAIIHSHRIIPKLENWVKNRQIRILAVGCCNLLEIYAFKSYGYEGIVGIDLVTEHPDQIQVMDMHDLKFGNDSFDVLYSSGTFHCTFDHKQLVSEFIRVVKNSGLICITVPVGFKPTPVYQFDPGSLDQLHQLFSPYLSEILWSEEVPPRSEFNPNGDPIIRTVFRIHKIPKVK